MRYEMISADCHIDLCWLPPDLFVNGASAAWKDRMPYVDGGAEGPVLDHGEGGQPGPRLRHGIGRARVRARTHLSLRPDGLHRALRRRQEGDPPPHRARAANKGPGPRRRAGRGALRDPRHDGAARRRRGRGRDHPRLQRVARRILLDASRAVRGPRGDPEPSARGRHRRGRARGQARGAARARYRQLGRHQAAVGSRTGTRCGRSSMRRACRCTSTRWADTPRIISAS